MAVRCVLEAMLAVPEQDSAATASPACPRGGAGLCVGGADRRKGHRAFAQPQSSAPEVGFIVSKTEETALRGNLR